MSPSPFQYRPGHDDDESIPVLTERLETPPLDFDTTLPFIDGAIEVEELDAELRPVAGLDAAPVPAAPTAPAAIAPLPQAPPSPAFAQPVAPPPVADLPSPVAAAPFPAAAAVPVAPVAPALQPPLLADAVAEQVVARVRARLEPEIERIHDVLAAFAREAIEQELRAALRATPAGGNPSPSPAPASDPHP